MSFYTNRDFERAVQLSPALIHALLYIYCDAPDALYEKCTDELVAMGLVKQEFGGVSVAPMGMAVIGRLTQPIVVTQVFRIEESPELTSWHPLKDAES